MPWEVKIHSTHTNTSAWMSTLRNESRRHQVVIRKTASAQQTTYFVFSCLCIHLFFLVRTLSRFFPLILRCRLSVGAIHVHKWRRCCACRSLCFVCPFVRHKRTLTYIYWTRLGWVQANKHKCCCRVRSRIFSAERPQHKRKLYTPSTQTSTNEHRTITNRLFKVDPWLSVCACLCEVLKILV